jgi:hypothetical protein
VEQQSAALLPRALTAPAPLQVKGCRGVRVQRCAVTDAGLQWDRQWMVVSATGAFITQARGSPTAAPARD